MLAGALLASTLIYLFIYMLCYAYSRISAIESQASQNAPQMATIDNGSTKLDRRFVKMEEKLKQMA